MRHYKSRCHFFYFSFAFCTLLALHYTHRIFPRRILLSMLWHTLCVVALVALTVDGTPTIKFCPSAEWDDGYTPLTESDFKNPSSTIRLSDKLCAEGNWALYTTTNWGADDLDTTLVYPVKGSSASKNCATGVKSTLSKIYSIRPLGVMADDVSMPQLTAFNKAYFLKDAEAPSSTGNILHDSTQKHENDVRSLAFAKELAASPSKSVVVCFGDSENCMCYNEKADVMIPDVTTLTTKKQLVDCISKTTVECPSNGVLIRDDPKTCPDTFKCCVS